MHAHPARGIARLTPTRMLYAQLFFFQAEDGIRDRDVTGVQTCALPISLLDVPLTVGSHDLTVLCDAPPVAFGEPNAFTQVLVTIGGVDLSIYSAESGGPAERIGPPSAYRSEERRVGKECGWRWWRCSEW